jgi:hypothetical protein
MPIGNSRPLLGIAGHRVLSLLTPGLLAMWKRGHESTFSFHPTSALAYEPHTRWLEARRQELLPTRYVHVVFTLPHQLARLLQTPLRRPPSTYRRRALSLPIHQAPGFEPSLADYNRTKPDYPPARCITDCPSLFHHSNTIEFA